MLVTNYLPYMLVESLKLVTHSLKLCHQHYDSFKEILRNTSFSLQVHQKNLKQSHGSEMTFGNDNEMSICKMHFKIVFLRTQTFTVFQKFCIFRLDDRIQDDAILVKVI